MSETEKDKLITLFRHLVDKQEEERKTFAHKLHSEILPLLFSLKLSLFSQKKYPSCEQTDEQNAAEIIDALSNELRVTLYQLYPSLLSSFGLVFAIESHLKEIIQKQNREIQILKEMHEEDAGFSKEFQLNVFRVFEMLIENILLNQPETPLTITIRTNENNFHLKLEREAKNSLNTKETLDRMLLDARLMLLKARVGNETDWVNAIDLVFPIVRDK